MDARELEQYNRAQILEIEKYKWLESEKTGYDIGIRRAAFEWIEKYSAAFHERYGRVSGSRFSRG